MAIGTTLSLGKRYWQRLYDSPSDQESEEELGFIHDKALEFNPNIL
jgi:hypothetical protein